MSEYTRYRLVRDRNLTRIVQSFQEIMGLDGWDITVADTAPDEADVTGECRIDGERRAVIYLSDPHSMDSLRSTILHELAHLAIDPVDAFVRLTLRLEDMFDEWKASEFAQRAWHFALEEAVGNIVQIAAANPHTSIRRMGGVKLGPAYDIRNADGPGDGDGIPYPTEHDSGDVKNEEPTAPANFDMVDTNPSARKPILNQGKLLAVAEPGVIDLDLKGCGLDADVIDHILDVIDASACGWVIYRGWPLAVVSTWHVRCTMPFGKVIEESIQGLDTLKWTVERIAVQAGIDIARYRAETLGVRGTS